MKQEELKEICNKVAELAMETGQFIVQERKEMTADSIEVKGVHNFVTDIDKKTEEFLVKGLSNILPNAGFIAEEGTGSKNDHYNWIIDPIDGTTNFIHGAPPYSISIALMDQEEVLVGVIYELTLIECFTAWKGGGAFLNNNPIKVSKTGKVDDALVATGFPYTDYDRMEAFMETIRHFMKHSHGIRRLGSAAADLAYVACGRYDAFYEYGLSPWDVAAGVLLIQEAGGRLSDFEGGDNYIFGGEMIAASGMVFEEFRDDIMRIMKD